MRQIYPDDGLVYFLERMAVLDIHVHLFENDFTPDRDTVVGDLDEPTWDDYAAAVVEAADWTTSGVAAHVGSLIAAAVGFDNNSGGDVDVYGYFLTNSAGDKLLAAARFDAAPITIPDGESHAVIPILGDASRLSS